MTLYHTWKFTYRMAAFACFLVASQIIFGASHVLGQTWGGLYNMDKMLSEGHPFKVYSASDARPATNISKQDAEIIRTPPKILNSNNLDQNNSNNLAAKHFFSEIRIGALLHDTGPFSANDEDGLDTNLEFIFASPKFFSAIWSPRPHVGISYNSDGDTSQAYIGLTWSWTFLDQWFADFSLGGMVHDGHLVGVDGESKSLGCRALFRESLGVGYKINKHHALSLHFDHSSNASLCEKNTRDGTAHGRHDVVLNEGLENIGIRYGYMF